MSNPFISVVVLAYNQFERTTLPCLESLAPWLADLAFEFIVYDNASLDGSGLKAEQWCGSRANVRFIQGSSNLGYAGGMNAAASHATGNWLFLVNNDTEFAPYALDALKKVLKSAPAHMAMIGPVTNAAGNGQRLYDPSKSKEEWMELGAWLNQNPTGLLLPTYRCDFFCIAIRRDAWIQLNGLDTIFGMGYFEDFDFSLRLRDAGFDQSITEDVFVYHQGSATFSKNSDIHALIKHNKRIMKKRHASIRFFHVRQSTLLLLKKQLSHFNNIQTTNLRTRIDLRRRSIQKDFPKSLLKRLIWRIITKKFL